MLSKAKGQDGPWATQILEECSIFSPLHKRIAQEISSEYSDTVNDHEYCSSSSFDSRNDGTEFNEFTESNHACEDARVIDGKHLTESFGHSRSESFGNVRTETNAGIDDIHQVIWNGPGSSEIGIMVPECYGNDMSEEWSIPSNEELEDSETVDEDSTLKPQIDENYEKVQQGGSFESSPTIKDHVHTNEEPKRASSNSERCLRPTTRSSRKRDENGEEKIQEKVETSFYSSSEEEVEFKPTKRLSRETRDTTPRRGRSAATKKQRLSEEPSSLAEGEAVEVLTDGDWWEAFSIAERADGCVCVRYVGGTESEDEWIPRQSARIRRPQDPARIRRNERDGLRNRQSRLPRSEFETTSTGPPQTAGTVPVQIPKNQLQKLSRPRTKAQEEAVLELARKEEEVKRCFRLKGLDIRLNERVSVVNKKVDICLRPPHKFTRTLLLQSLLEGKNNFPNHVVEVLNINSNGKDAKRPDSAIFGKPVALHMMVKPRYKSRPGGGGSDSSPSKVVIRFYKENASSTGTFNYLIQFNAGGFWSSDQSVVLLVVDIFQPFGVTLGDVQVRKESSLYSVSNTNTFPGRRINVQDLLAKLKKTGQCNAKLLGATGGISMEFKSPQCKPQVQVTGTIYVPFCGEPRQARLAVLQLLLQYVETIEVV